MINIDMINIGEKLKQAMKESRQSWKEIATKAKIPEPTLYRLITKQDIKVSTLLKLASTLNVPMEFFFGVTETDLVKELKQLLDEERSKNHMLTKALDIMEQQFSMMFSFIKEFEGQESPDKQMKLTLVEREESRKITLSHFFLIYMRMISASKVAKKEEMYLKYAEQFLNIVEVRKALKENPLFMPGGSVGILGEIIESNAVDTFIDVKEFFKSLK